MKIDVQSRFDTSILTSSKVEGNSNSDEIEILVHDSDEICAFYVHFCILNSFENVDNQLVVDVVYQCHYQGKGVFRQKRDEGREGLEKVKELNRRTGNNLKFTMQEI